MTHCGLTDANVFGLRPKVYAFPSQMLARHPPTETHRSDRARIKPLALPPAGSAICESETENLPGSVAPESGAIFRPQKRDQKDEHQQWVLIFLAAFLWPENGPEIRAHFSAIFFRPRRLFFYAFCEDWCGLAFRLMSHYSHNGVLDTGHPTTVQQTVWPGAGILNFVHRPCVKHVYAPHYAWMIEIVKGYMKPKHMQVQMYRLLL